MGEDVQVACGPDGQQGLKIMFRAPVALSLQWFGECEKMMACRNLGSSV